MCNCKKVGHHASYSVQTCVWLMQAIESAGQVHKFCATRQGVPSCLRTLTRSCLLEPVQDGLHGRIFASTSVLCFCGRSTFRIEPKSLALEI